jgi:hypothetical protein
MPIYYRLDHRKRLVLARGYGTITETDLVTYQREVWSRPDVAGYDELVDMTGVQNIERPSVDRIMTLSTMSASMDSRSQSSKFAIVAPDDLAFGLGRMYQAYRGLDARSTKHVEVFRTLAEALEFLGMDRSFEPWPGEASA